MGGPAAHRSKPINRPGWWKGKFASFWMLAIGSGGGWQTSVQRLTAHPPDKQEVRAFIDRIGGVCAETA